VAALFRSLGGRSAHPTLPPPFIPVRNLGAGGEGIAWLAQDPRLGRSVVLKRLSSEQQGAQSDWLTIMAGADLPQVPTVYDSLHHGGAQWLVIEYVKGMPLVDLNGIDSPVGLTAWYALAVDLASALAALHKAGLVHGDIAPGNVVIDHHGRARLIDFGQMARSGERLLNAVVPGFRAPETMLGGLLSEATDCYSLGALLHWVLSGAAPELLEQGDGSYRVCCATPDGPMVNLATTLWHCIAALTTPEPTQRITADRVLQRLAEARYELPEGIDGGRQALMGHVFQYGDSAALEPSSPELMTSLDHHRRSGAHLQQRDGEYFPKGLARAMVLLTSLSKPLFAGLTFSAALLILIAVALMGQHSQSADITVLVDSMAITPNTPMPSQLNRTWLIEQLQAGFRESEADAEIQSLTVSLTCQTTYCQLVGEHQRGLDTHWHQVSMVATESAGIWSGLLQDFSRQVAAD